MPQKRAMSVKVKDGTLSAPPLDLMDKIVGYETMTYDAVIARPPAVQLELLNGPTEIKNSLDTKFHISEKEAREILYFYVGNQCCYGKTAARDMTVTRNCYSSVFHYTLQSFTEKRQTSWAFEPYNGEVLDLPSNGVAPQPWEVEVEPPKPFLRQVSYIEVPHTASVKPCHHCCGSGKITDTVCGGDGEVACLHCHGDGNKMGSIEPCVFCTGKGHEKCTNCSGCGYHLCKVCCGKGQLKCFIKLTVTWTNHIDDHIADNADIPQKLIKRVKGTVVLEDEQPNVWPISHFPDTTINMASAQLIRNHAANFRNERMLRQKHYVRLVPVNIIHYEWMSHGSKFYVFGIEKEVYVPDYPQSCCWGATSFCTIT